MAKIPDEKRNELASAIIPYDERIKAIEKKEKQLIDEMKKSGENVEIKKIAIISDLLFLSSLYMVKSSLSEKIIDAKNNDALNDSRKVLYRAVIYLEETVTNFIDVPYSDLTKNWEAIESVSVQEKYFLIRKFLLVLNLLKHAFGENSKWKWSFVELEGRVCTIAKNLIDMKKASKDFFEPSSDGYEVTVSYIRLVDKLLEVAAKQYRDKYELSSRRIDDMASAIKYLRARHKLCIAINDKENAEEVKKRADVWKEKMDADNKSGLSS